MSRFLVIILSFIFVNSAMVGIAADVSVPDETKLNVNQTSNLTQSQTTYGSTSSSNLVYSPTTISQRGFAGGAQPQFPGSVGYGGPWKESWNVISTDMYKLMETFWSVRDVRRAKKGGGEIKALYWQVPSRGSSALEPSGGVNVVFGLEGQTTLPTSSEVVAIGAITVKGGEKATLWHLVGKAVLEASERGATWLKIEKYNYSPQIKSSSFGLGLATTGAGINSSGDLSVVNGGGTGWAKAKAGPICEPFIHAVAYVPSATLKAAIEALKKTEESKEEKVIMTRIDAPGETAKTERPFGIAPKTDSSEETIKAQKLSIVPGRKPEGLMMIVQSQSGRGKEKMFDVRLKNVTKEQIYVSPTYFRLETKDGKRHPFSRETYTHTSCLWGKSLEPGEEVSGVLVFATNSPVKRLVYNDMSLVAASVEF